MWLMDNLCCYIWNGRGNNCNSYLFTNVLRGHRPHVLIDPGHVVNELKERCWDHLLSSMARDGIEAEDIGLIIITHFHPDHCEANQALVERSRAKKVKGEANRALITLHEDEAEYQRGAGEWWARNLGTEAKFEPDFYLREGILKLGKERKINLDILHIPGHSPGSIGLYWSDNRVLITGDVVFYGAVGRTDIPGGDGRILKESIDRLSQLDIEYLLPGHSTEFGSIIKGEEKVKQNFTFIKMNYFPLL
ncbi:MAG: MBL fold metallo-hydrolase [Dehalococcoidia bacterium]